MTKTSASCADRDLVTFIRRFIGSSLASGDVTITKAAKAADINARTLQRRLGAVGLTYSQVVDEVRLGTAIRLLVRPEMSLSEIALTLGYSDPGHFTRAFKRWTGETPTVFRKRLRQGRRR